MITRIPLKYLYNQEKFEHQKIFEMDASYTGDFILEQTAHKIFKSFFRQNFQIYLQYIYAI